MAYSDLVTELETAISSVVLNGQYITSEGVTYKKADLDKLKETHAYYLGLSNQETGNIFNDTKTGVPYRG